ncbi:MAG: response regulator transcription factor [Candidatus Electrothrix aestuarii]|uniref:Response regulator transcription factor n=1 Tax=Candidatus Electrothrix aestuarii TaxID=3062594 RepID=A0AAU8LZF0_9BACT|nr:response regulator transcription factor [Candidatus Electrothrix aestuarii]WPD23241.1 MAG: response regulator transcription factor [Candidatus Electrothrix sp. GW3-3]
MSKANILVVEDDMDIQQLVSYHLIRAGYNVSCADSGEQGLQILEKEKFSAVILDLMLPGKNGLEVCSTIRENKQNQHIPVIMLTALGEEDDIVAGLDGGADDYVTKPFSPKVLMARVEAVLRRDTKNRKADAEDEEVVAIHDLRITPQRHEVLVADKPVQLTTTEFTILLLLARRPGWVFSRQQIIDQVRGYDYSVTPRAVDVQIFGLRKKLGKTGKNIETVRGIGYRLKE